MKQINTDVLIIGAGPVGLFSVFQLGQLGMKSCVVDCLPQAGGQCSELYPEKPIYDIPAYPVITGNDLVENFENISVLYNVDKKNIFHDKTIAIAGGGDSAVDWAIELSSITKKIYFIHRREKLRAAPNSVEKLKNLSLDKNIEMIIPYQIDSIQGQNGKIETLTVKDLNNETRKLEVDYFLPFFGLSTKLGPISNWGLEIEKKILRVDQSSCQTSKKGIYGIGDICNYPGKLKLILTGFAEAAAASHHCYKLVFPDKSLHFEYSTTKGINTPS